MGLRSGTAVQAAEEAGPDAELYFQRCRWCHTTTFQRLLCPTCGSTDLNPELSEGEGVISVRRGVAAADADLWPVYMTEGFTVRCRVDGPLHAVRPGVRVKVSSGVGVTGRRPVGGGTECHHPPLSRHPERTGQRAPISSVSCGSTSKRSPTTP
ncbi:zinc ribbon domain-containing protein [Streptomyces flavochromogenes]|uniref:zinc ribbon domain-containing protein n=1 Tax=Streptomyces flavochromogenes TaxID=68199 RepID=UPI001FD767C0|nr:zinc ribbon domain-containing protein [Streptomyces flavochromogenes]